MTEAAGSEPALSDVLKTVLPLLEGIVLSHHAQHGDDTIVVPAERRRDVARALMAHDALQFDLLMDTTVVDWPEEEPRFEVVDHLFSTRRTHRIRLKCRVTEEDPTVPSLTPLFGSANWMEREAYDMFGVLFADHPDLRRVLLYPQFEGHPLRKDYDKLDEQPLFEPRYHGTRESDG